MAPSMNGNVVTTAFNTNLGDPNSGDPATLEQFITWAGANAPAQHYALVMWGHGGGVFGVEYHDANVPGPTNLSVTSLASALQASPVKVDLLAFDSCFMVTTEVASAVSPFVSDVVGCEGDVPAAGYEYDQAFSVLATNPGLVSAQALGAGMVQSVAAGFNIPPSSLGQQTQSVVDVSKMGAIEAALKNFTSTQLYGIAPGIERPAYAARGCATGCGRFYRERAAVRRFHRSGSVHASRRHERRHSGCRCSRGGRCARRARAGRGRQEGRHGELEWAFHLHAGLCFSGQRVHG